MHNDLTLSIVIIVLELLFMATVVAVVSKRLRFPFTIGLVIIGLLLSWASKSIPLLHTLTSFKLTPGVVLFIFLPALLFHSAFNLDARHLMKNIFTIYVLAVPALLISTVTVGFIVHYFLGLPIEIALLFGALISATDPVAVVALFEEMGAPKRLHLLVEGESLFNDGTALVVFNIILGVVLTGTFTGSTISKGIVDFFIVALGGTAVGIVMGVLFSWFIEKVENNPLVEITLTTLLAHSSFIVAEQLLHVSGVIATVIAGLTLGGYGRSKISPSVLSHMESFWEYFAFVSNSLIFLLVGLSIDLSLFGENIQAILWAALSVVIARALAVYSLFPTLKVFKIAEKVSPAFQTVIFWGGLRGALAIVMVLSIPEHLPVRSYLLVLTFGVVLISLLVNGLTIKPLMSLLGLDKYSLKESLERSQAMLDVKEKTRKKVIPFASKEGIDTEIALEKEKSYTSTIDSLRRELDELKKKVRVEDETEVVLRHCLLMEKNHYNRLFTEGMLSEDSLKDMQLSIERQLDRIKEGKEVTLDGNPSFLVRMIEALGGITFFKLFTQGIKTTMIARSYEMERARLAVSTPVLKELMEMKKQNIISDAAFQKVEKLYNDLREMTVSRMESLWLDYPEYAEIVEKRILDRFCLNSEFTTYKELYDRGVLTDKVFLEMREHIDEMVRKMKMIPIKVEKK